jgi:hypothetical protein
VPRRRPWGGGTVSLDEICFPCEINSFILVVMGKELIRI